jgi:tRNA(Arg) A34 adenosine deaminase TadA
VVAESELGYLRRCIELATEAAAAGSGPFGSVLVAEDGTILAEDHNRDGDGDPTQHPELALARWAAANMTPEQRAAATVYTSGEHCPMCAAAHGWVGLGRIVYAGCTLTIFGEELAYAMLGRACSSSRWRRRRTPS